MNFKKIMLGTTSLALLPLTVLTFNNLKITTNNKISTTSLNTITSQRVNILDDNFYMNSGYNSVTKKITHKSIFESSQKQFDLEYINSDLYTKAITHREMNRYYDHKYSFLHQNWMSSLTNENSNKNLKPLKIYYYFKESGTLKNLSLNSQVVKNDARSEASSDKNKFFTDYGDSYISQIDIASVGGIEINILPNSTKGLTELKNNFWSESNYRMNPENRNIDNLGNIDWNLLSEDTNSSFSINVKGFGLGLDPNNKLNFIKKLNHFSIRSASSKTIDNSFKKINNIFKDYYYNQFSNESNIFNSKNDNDINIKNMLLSSEYNVGYDKFNLPNKNLSNTIFLDKVQSSFNKYRELKKDITIMYSNEDAINIDLKKQIFKNYSDGDNSVEYYLDNIQQILANNINLFSDGQETDDNDLVLKDINSNLAKIFKNPLLKKLDYILRFEFSFDETYPLYTNDFSTKVIPIPLDVDTLNGASNNYNYYVTEPGIDQPSTSTFKLDYMNLNLTRFDDLLSYNEALNGHQYFAVYVGMYDVMNGEKTDSIKQTFIYNGIEEGTKRIEFSGDFLSNSVWTMSSLYWAGKKNDNVDWVSKRVNNRSYCNFEDMFNVTSNWK